VIELGLFWTCAFGAIAGAIGAATARNLFHAALLLGLSLAGVAGLYLFLHASYLACVQVVVYIGGILVLILFATLFSADIMGAAQRAPRWLVASGMLGALLAAGVALRLAQGAIAAGTALDARGPQPAPDAIGSVDAGLGALFVGPWFVPFLLAGLLLTVALVGAVATVRRYRRPLETPHG
jgi:NADH:ubiquinone oxidoreductase subunit 6 (subunit J)